MIKSKIWGTTEKIFDKNNVELDRIHIKKGGYCSKHYHKTKYNLFYVENGVLEIKVQENDSKITNSTILYTGQSTIIEPGKLHIFIAIEETVAYEFYWTELDQEDIVRQTFGGVMKFEDSIYTGRFFRRRIKKYHQHELEYAKIFYEAFKPKVVYDAGCALGSYLLAFKEKGCTVVGWDKYYQNAKPYCDPHIIDDLIEHDACQPLTVNRKSDLTLCIEVAEHIPPLSSQDLIRNICDVSNDYIIFTAAQPGQRGTGHINCRTKDFWRGLFTSFGFSRDRKRELLLKDKINLINDPLGLIKNMIVLKRHTENI